MDRLPPPVPGVITQEPNPGHDAYDFACRVGTPVIAVHDGVIKVWRDGRLGLQIRLLGPDGVQSLYAHLESVEAHGEVSKGDVIGTCGNTGAWSTGPHLHFEHNRPYYF